VVVGREGKRARPHSDWWFGLYFHCTPNSFGTAELLQAKLVVRAQPWLVGGATPSKD